MTFLKLYLIGYFVLLIGAGMALWQAGVLDDIPGMWLAAGVVIAIGFGIMLASQVIDELVYNERHNELIFVKYIDGLTSDE